MSALSAKALEIARGELAAGIRGHELPMWGRFRGLRVDEYQRAVSLPLAPNPQLQGFPWCAAGVHWCFDGAARELGLPNPCPRTGGALKMWDAAQDAHGTHSPSPGDVFVLDRGGGGHGHVGFVELVEAGGVLTTVEPDTGNRALSATGDAWGRHTWDPAEGARGVLLGFLTFE
jgi:hypothetical protein